MMQNFWLMISTMPNDIVAESTAAMDFVFWNPKFSRADLICLEIQACRVWSHSLATYEFRSRSDAPVGLNFSSILLLFYLSTSILSTDFFHCAAFAYFIWRKNLSLLQVIAGNQRDLNSIRSILCLYFIFLSFILPSLSISILKVHISWMFAYICQDELFMKYNRSIFFFTWIVCSVT